MFINTNANLKIIMEETLSAQPIVLATTLGDWLEYWLETYIRPTAKPSAYEHYADNCRKHIIPVIGDLPLDSITTAILQTFLNVQSKYGNLRDNGDLSPKSIKNMRVVLNSALSRAVSAGLLSSNPMAGTIIRSVPSKNVEVMSDESEARLEHYLKSADDHYAAGVLLAMHTGMRLGEVCALRWRDYDPDNCSIRIRETVRRISFYGEESKDRKTGLVFNSPKSEASNRELFVPVFLKEVLENQRSKFCREFCRQPSPDDFVVFSSLCGVTDPDNLSHYFRNALTSLGLPHVKFHALRHTFATRELEHNVDIGTVSGILGHAKVTTTAQFYIIPRREAMRQAMLGLEPLSKNYNAPSVG